MNKKYIPGVIVVEGKHDASKLANLYETVFVITNGYEIPSKEISFLKALKSDTSIIVLTDKDEAGEEIRKKVNNVRPNCINIEIEAPKSSKKKGVAECDIKDIEKALDKYVVKPTKHDEYDLYELGLIGNESSKKNREIISNKFNLGLINKSNMIKRLILLNIKKEELIKELEQCNK